MYTHMYIHMWAELEPGLPAAGGAPRGYPQVFRATSELKSKLSGNEVYDTACSSLVISENSWSKPHCHKVSI